jgi:hydroxyethylthiazole kinase
MSVSAGASLRAIHERRPLVHQITNYVVMNETANATLALGALPVMAHAPEEVEEMAAAASALVLNIGTLSAPWVEAMLLAGKAANRAHVPVVLDPVGAGATRFRRESAERILGEMKVSVLRGNAGEIASLAGHEAEVRGVDSISVAVPPDRIASSAAKLFGCVAAVSGPIDYVSDGDEVLAVKNGHPLMTLVTGTGCMATAMVACFVAVKQLDPLAAAAEALAAFGVAGEDAAAGAKGPGTFHVALYDALHDLDPETLDRRVRIS